MPTPAPLSEMIRRARPAVVRIENSTGTGSGAIFDIQGQTAYIITNQHVVDRDAEVSVTVNDSAYYRGTVLGTDSVRDLAVVRICCGSFSELPFGDAARLQPGDEVVTIGYALGLPGEATITRGIVSAVRYHSGYLSEVIQTDAAVNFGNSGGPTLSMSGEILGINTFGLRDSEGLNFAISGITVQQRIPALMTAQAAPTPTPTWQPPPSPRPTQPSVPIYTGDWTYFGPDCPQAYPNCASFSSDNPFISLVAFNHGNESRHDSPWTSVACSIQHGRVEVRFFSGGPKYYMDDEVFFGTRVGDEEEFTFMWPEFVGDEAVNLNYQDSLYVVRKLWDAETTGKTIAMGTEFRGDILLGQFDAAGVHDQLLALALRRVNGATTRVAPASQQAIP